MFKKHRRNLSFDEDDFNKRIALDAKMITVNPENCDKNNIFNRCYKHNKLNSDEMIKDIPQVKVFLMLAPYI